jgi:hypothetical protein
MPAVHNIDHNRKLIITTWDGEPTVQDLASALNKYRKEIKELPEYIQYDELVDLSSIGGVKLNSSGLRVLADIAAKSDKTGIRTKLAIVVKPGLTFGLARMYEIYRNLNPSKSKEIKIFQETSSASDWLQSNNS